MLKMSREESCTESLQMKLEYYIPGKELKRKNVSKIGNSFGHFG